MSTVGSNTPKDGAYEQSGGASPGAQNGSLQGVPDTGQYLVPVGIGRQAHRTKEFTMGSYQVQFTTDENGATPALDFLSNKGVLPRNGVPKNVSDLLLGAVKATAYRGKPLSGLQGALWKEVDPNIWVVTFQHEGRCYGLTVTLDHEASTLVVHSGARAVFRPELLKKLLQK